MMLRRVAIGLLTSAVALGSALPAFAQDEQAMQDQELCKQVLNLTDAQAVIRSYKIRLDACIRDKASERMKDTRIGRLKTRSAVTSKRLTTDDSSFQLRRFGSLKDPKKQLEEKMKLQQADYRVRKADPRNYTPDTKLSRRTLQREGVNAIEARKKQSGKILRDRQNAALKACESVKDNSHAHANCVREKFRAATDKVK